MKKLVFLVVAVVTWVFPGQAQTKNQPLKLIQTITLPDVPSGPWRIISAWT